MSWNDLCKPKSSGGLGFRDLGIFNYALLAKQVWGLMINGNSLCARILKAKYFSNCDVLDSCLGPAPN